MAKDSLQISKNEIELQLGEFKNVALRLETELTPMLMEDVRQSGLKNKEQRDELEITIQDMKNDFKEAFMQLDCMHNRATRERSDLQKTIEGIHDSINKLRAQDSQFERELKLIKKFCETNLLYNRISIYMD